MKVYLAGMESQENKAVVDAGLIDNAFFSYYYIRNKIAPEVLIAERPKIANIILDSGAHTFFSEMHGEGLSVSVHIKRTKTKQTPEDYFANYVQWLKKWGHLVDYFVELDIGEIVTQKRVKEWREILKQEGLYQKCITVYHPTVVNWEDYLEMLDDSQSKYIALEGDRPNRPRLPYNKLIKPAYEKQIKVHGFAFLKREGLFRFPFYSVDASSWKSGTQYGSSISVSKSKIKAVRFIKESPELFALSKEVTDLKYVLDEDKSLQRFKRAEIAIHAYREMERYYTELWQKRGINWQD